jgi:hypothetical protein
MQIVEHQLIKPARPTARLISTNKHEGNTWTTFVTSDNNGSMARSVTDLLVLVRIALMIR